MTVWVNGSWIYYTNSANVADSFDYTISDGYWGGTANGTVLITGPIGGDPSLAGQRHQLVPGEPVAVQPGWILDLGDGVTILIDRA